MRMILVSLSVLLLAVLPPRAHAQWLAPAGVQITRLAATGLEPAVREISASKYVWRGALIGGVALGAIAAVLIITADECLGCLHPVILAPVVVGAGAILGAAVGYVVYRARR
jgi:hypothetical protein